MGKSEVESASPDDTLWRLQMHRRINDLFLALKGAGFHPVRCAYPPGEDIVVVYIDGGNFLNYFEFDLAQRLSLVGTSVGDSLPEWRGTLEGFQRC